MTTLEQTEITPGVYARRWRTLGVLCLSLTIVMTGNVSLNLALPAIARDLGASTSALQWMVDAYALVFAGLLFTAGTLGDRFGRKGALQAGLVLFLVAAAAATLATTAAAIIAARAVMGVAAAFVMPSTLSILTNVFPASERPRAIAVWVGIAAGGAAVGPVVTGVLLEHFWWGAVFLINVPLVLSALIAGRWWVPTSRDPDEAPIDAVGAVLSVAAIGALVYAIIEAPHHGWGSGHTLVAFGAAVAGLGLFVLREHTARHPMLDLRLFGDRRFSVASGGIALTFFAMFGTFFLVAQYVQLVLDHSPLVAGLVVLPMPVVMMLVAPQVPRFVDRFGAALVVPVGLGLLATGLVAMSLLTTDSPLWAVPLVFLPMAVGMGATGTPLTALMMSSVPPGRAGVGSAMNDTSREVGGALGVAVLGSLVTTQFTSSIGPLPAAVRDQAGTGLPGALEAAGRLAGADGAALAHAARNAYVDGFGLAVLAAAGLLILAAAAARTLIPRVSPEEGPVPMSAGPRADVGAAATREPAVAVASQEQAPPAA